MNIHSQENVEINLFYSGNLENPDNKRDPVLLLQDRVNFSDRNKRGLFPPQQLEFVSENVGSRIKRSQTFSIILPNLIHQLKKRDLKR